MTTYMRTVSLSRQLLHSAARYSTPQSKIWRSADEAILDSVRSGQVVLSGGFGLCGNPDTLIHAIARRSSIQRLTVVSNNAGVGHHGLGLLFQSGQIEKLISSYPGANKELEALYLKGRISLELIPQGTLAERLRAHAAGIPAFYTPTGASTAVETGAIPIRYNEGGMSSGVRIPGQSKESRIINGRRCLLETAIAGDIALVKAWKVDTEGNCVFRYAANNFNSVMARNAALTIVEAENMVPAGKISPNAIHLPGIYVDRIVPSTVSKEFENIVLLKTEDSPETRLASRAEQIRHRIARRAAKEIKPGDYVNLGIGMPTLVAGYIDPEMKVWLQSENGILGMGPHPTKETVDADIVNAGKETVTLLQGSSVFDTTESFAMIRGGHMDIAILGVSVASSDHTKHVSIIEQAMQVSQFGDIANFMIPGKVIKGIGGAMDLVSNPDKTKVVAVMEHCDKQGNPKIVRECTLPLTGAGAVSKIITELAVFEIDRMERRLRLIELADGVDIELVRAKTGCEFVECIGG